MGPAVFGVAPVSQASGPVNAISNPRHPAVHYSRIPLYFEANRGQAPADVRYLSRGQGYVLYLTDTGPVLALQRSGTGSASGHPAGKPRETARSAVVGMTLVGARAGAPVHGRQRQSGVVNYLVGKDPKRWHRRVPTYRRVVYSGVYPGIDLAYHGRQTQLEYDFDIAAGADPAAIRLSFTGIDGMRVDGAGRLHLRTGGGEVIEKAPVAYQRIDGTRRAVAVRYAVTGSGRVTFAVSAYDRSHKLIIDPVLSFSSYLGGGENDRAMAIAADPNDGNVVYITGRTASGLPPPGDPRRSFLTGVTDALGSPANSPQDPDCGGVVNDCTDVRLTYTFFNGKFGADPAASADAFSEATLYPNMWSDTSSGTVGVVRDDRLLLITGTAKNAETSTSLKASLSGDFDTRVSMSQLDQADKFSGIEVSLGGDTFDWGVASNAAAQQFELDASNGGAGCSASAPALTTDTSKTPFVKAQDIKVVRSQSTLSFYYRAAGANSFTLGGTCTNASTADAKFKLLVQTREGAATQTTTGKTSVFENFHLTSSTTAAQTQAGITVTQPLSGDFDAHVTVGLVMPSGATGKDTGLQVTLSNNDTFKWYFSIPAANAAPSLQLDPGSSSGTCSPEPSLSSLDLTGVKAEDVEVVRRGSTLSFYYRMPNTIQFTLGETCTNINLAGSTRDSTATFKLYTASADSTSKTVAFDDFHAEQSNGAPDAFVMRLHTDTGRLDYATYLGGSGQDEGRAIRADASGNAYVAGRTDSADVTTSASCPDINGDSVCDNGGDAFVAKLDSTGQLKFFTYFGGCYDDGANAIDVISNLNNNTYIYIAGYTSSASDATAASGAGACVTGFPARGANGQAAFQTSNNGRSDAFVAQYVAPVGSNSYTLNYATYLGGTHSDEALGIAAVQSTGEAVVTGDTASGNAAVGGFPMVNQVACPQCDSTHYHAFVSEIDAEGKALLNSTLLGGSGYDYGSAVAVHARTNSSNVVTSVDAYVTGWTRSDDFPVQPQTVVQATHHGSYDVFFSKLNLPEQDAGQPSNPSNPMSLKYSTYLGTTDIEAGQGIAVYDCKPDCSVWITGYTMAPDFLVALLRDKVPGLDAPLDFLQDYQSVGNPSSDTPEQSPDTDVPHNDQPNLNNYVLDNLSVQDLASTLYQMDSSVDLTTLASLSRSELIGRIFDVVDGLVAKNLHAIQRTRRGLVDGFLVNLASDGSGGYGLAEATYLGGRHENYVTGIAVDNPNNANANPYVVGYTQAADFPVSNDSQYCPSDNSDNRCGEDGFVAKINGGLDQNVDLSVAMSKNTKDAVDPGTNVTFTMTVKNNSSQQVSGVQLVDNIPIGLQLVSASTNKGSCRPTRYDPAQFNHTVTCNLGTLKAGATATVNVTVMTTAETESPTQNPGTTLPTGPPPQVNSATVTGLATDDVPGNNSASVKISVNRTFIPPENTPHPVLSQKFPTFQGIDPPGGSGALGLLSLAVLAVGAGWRRRSDPRRQLSDFR